MTLCFYDDDVGLFLQFAQVFSVSSWVLSTLPAKGLQGEGWRHVLQGKDVFAPSLFSFPLKLSDLLVSAFVFSTSVDVPGSPAAMAGAQRVQGKSLTQRPELYQRRMIHIFRVCLTHAFNNFSPIFFGPQLGEVIVSPTDFKDSRFQVKMTPK